VKAVEARLGRELDTDELRLTCDEWFSCSQRFLDSGDTCEDHFAALLAELSKVRVPTGEGATLTKALEAVSKLSFSDRPEIPSMPGAPEHWRRLLALHRELARLSANKDNTYFLSYRDAAKASPMLSPQRVHNLTTAFDRFGAIKVVSKGEARPGGKAAEFRYLLSDAGNGTSQSESRDSVEAPF
jgi:hypothetical protein